MYIRADMYVENIYLQMEYVGIGRYVCGEYISANGICGYRQICM